MENDLIIVLSNDEKYYYDLFKLLSHKYKIIHFNNELNVLAYLNKISNDFGMLIISKEERFFNFVKEYRISKEVATLLISEYDFINDNIERYYEIGIDDYILYPLREKIVRGKIFKNLKVSEKNNNLQYALSNNILISERIEKFSLYTLGFIINFRNGNDGFSLIKFKELVSMLLNSINKLNVGYNYSPKQINDIAYASSICDIGKLFLPPSICNKSHLDKFEKTILESHTTLGATIIQNIPFAHHNAIYDMAYRICKYHHERFDGKGYPNHLVGNEIPFEAQVVSIVSAYFQLKSFKIDKKIYTTHEALQMIYDGKCGAFNPLLIKALKQINEKDIAMLDSYNYENNSQYLRKYSLEELSRPEMNDTYKVYVNALKKEYNKNNYIAYLIHAIIFEYDYTKDILYLDGERIVSYGLNNVILKPFDDSKLIYIIGEEGLKNIKKMVYKSLKKKIALNMKIKPKQNTYFLKKIQIYGELSYEGNSIKSLYGIIQRI